MVIENDVELKNNIDSMVQYLDLSDGLAQKFNQTDIILSNRIIRGALYSAMFDFGKADSTLNEALLQARSAKKRYEESLILYNYGRLKLNQVKYDEAIELFAEGLRLAKKTDTKIYKLITSQLLGELYQKVNKPLAAIEFMNIAHNEYRISTKTIWAYG
jgi:tetratricopeptide (TPR) repeat protein